MLPRNKLNKKYKTKSYTTKDDYFESKLVSLCTDHNVKPLELRNCMLINEYGKITNVNINTVVLVNMRASVIVLKYVDYVENDDDLYDLYKIAYDKKIREEYNKKNKEYESLKNNGLIDENDEGNNDEKGENNEEINEEKEVNNEEVNEEKEVNNEKKEVNDEEKKPKEIKRNKYHNNFMKNLKEKFGKNIALLPEYKYVEVKKDNSSFVIEHSKVYTIINKDTKYMLIVGDLNLKRDVIRSIDSSYGTDKLKENKYVKVDEEEKREVINISEIIQESNKNIRENTEKITSNLCESIDNLTEENISKLSEQIKNCD